jgi:type I restriction enzyme S subunit
MSDDLDFDMEVVEKGQTDLTNKTEVTSSECEPKTSSEGMSSDGGQKGQSFLVGDLPIDWKAERLESVCDINPDSFSPDGENGTFEYISLSDASEGVVLESKSVSIEEAPSRATRRVEEGDVLVGTVRPKQTSHGFVTEEHGGKVCSSGFGVLRAGESVNSQFLRQEVLSHRFFRQMMAYVAGSGYPAVKLSDLEKHRVAVPPLPEQRKIASVLYTVDQAIQKTEAIIEQARRAKRGLVKDLMTRGVGHDRYKKVHLGPKSFRVPASWKCPRLEEISHKITDGAHITPDYVEEGIPFLSTKNIDPFEEHFDFSGYERYVTKEDHRKLNEKCDPNRGDVLICRRATIGPAQLVRTDDPFSIFVGLGMIKPRKSVMGEYLEQFFNWEPIIKMLNVKSPGSTMKTLNLSTLRKQRIPLPPLPEQEEIVGLLSSVDEEVSNAKDEKKRLERLKKGLMQDLLTGEVRTADKAIDVLEDVEAHG